jgi:hypothetical protein
VVIGVALLAGVSGCRGGDSGAQNPPAGAPRTGTTGALETGAAVMQDLTPVKKIAVYLVGFHPMKDDPSVQMEAHHYCNQVNEDFAQCVLFDGNTEKANLHGLEYIISEKLFETLPQEERKYWHPHNYEILSGQLVGPGLPDVAEKELMRRKMNSYGKTWHVWNTGVHGKPGDTLPLGDPHLAWSFNRDGEAAPGLVQRRDTNMGIDSGAKRRDRADLSSLARPQEGVDALKAAFPDASGAPAGVQDKGAGSQR